MIGAYFLKKITRLAFAMGRQIITFTTVQLYVLLETKQRFVHDVCRLITLAGD